MSTMLPGVMTKRNSRPRAVGEGVDFGCPTGAGTKQEHRETGKLTRQRPADDAMSRGSFRST
jgi:hypothetical protein